MSTYTFKPYHMAHLIGSILILRKGKRPYHAHPTYPESLNCKGFIEFRDYLRIHLEPVQDYAEIKKQAATDTGQVGTHYRKLKKPIFDKIRSRGSDESLGCIASLNHWNLEEASALRIAK